MRVFHARERLDCSFPQTRGKRFQALRAPRARQDDGWRKRILEANDVYRELGRGESRRAEPIPGADLAE
jgi:hypothetical protein